MPEGLAGLAAKATLVLALLPFGLVVGAAVVLRLHGAEPGRLRRRRPCLRPPRETLNGPLVASGVIYRPHRPGRHPLRRPTCRGPGTRTAAPWPRLFRYDSGRTQQREWRILPGPDGRFTATADDVIGAGEARRLGRHGDPALSPGACRRRRRMGARRHRLALPRRGRRAIVNRSQFRRFGVLVGELVCTDPAGRRNEMATSRAAAPSSSRLAACDRARAR